VGRVRCEDSEMMSKRTEFDRSLMCRREDVRAVRWSVFCLLGGKKGRCLEEDVCGLGSH